MSARHRPTARPESVDTVAMPAPSVPSPRARSILALLACACLLVAAAPPVDAAAAPFGARMLKSGSKGKDVRALQRALTALGIPTGADGVFGPTTRKNVKRLERKQGWPVDGRVTRKDAKRIIKLAAKRRGQAKPTGTYFVSGLAWAVADVTAAKAGTARVDVVSDTTGLVRSFELSFSGPGTQQVAWDGWTTTAPVPDGIYRFKLAEPGSAGASISGGVTGPFGMYNRAFPVPGPHSFGGAGSRFGAPRSGHTHQGQDVAAACGLKLVAPELSRVSTNAYQASGAGYYLVLHGLISGTDYVFMHMKKASWAAAGTQIRAGQGVGKVGTTGSSTGCHLHFERWSAPGWYVGGSPYDPLPELTLWDAYS
ncbi:MAG: peptidoglycan DD-metalloendopeptidase family protein [Solirubrobacterales bacterium]